MRRKIGWISGVAAVVAWVAMAQEPIPAPAVTPVSVRIPSLVRLDHPPASAAELELPLALWRETQTEPQPMVAWLLRVDLRCPGLEVVAMTAEDPDEDGPAEAVLTAPLELAQRYGALAAVNANGFGRLPGPDGKVPEGKWQLGLPVDIAGLVVGSGVVRSPPDIQRRGNDLCFWMDADHRPHIGPTPTNTAAIRAGWNAWWIDLVADGRILPNPGGDRHPRTAVGLDASERWLLLAVVDGRQPRHSVGMTAHELAELMAKHGCRRAINLDGGGSSVLVAVEATGDLGIVNKPSDGKPRPLPVMLGIVGRR